MSKNYLLTLDSTAPQEGLCEGSTIQGTGNMGTVDLKILILIPPSEITGNKYELHVKSLLQSYYDENNPFSYIVYGRNHQNRQSVLKTTVLS